MTFRATAAFFTFILVAALAALTMGDPTIALAAMAAPAFIRLDASAATPPPPEAPSPSDFGKALSELHENVTHMRATIDDGSKSAAEIKELVGKHDEGIASALARVQDIEKQLAAKRAHEDTLYAAKDISRLHHNFAARHGMVLPDMVKHLNPSFYAKRQLAPTQEEFVKFQQLQTAFLYAYSKAHTMPGGAALSGVFADASDETFYRDMLHRVELAYSGGTEAAGGAMLPELQAMMIDEQMRQTVVMLQEADVRTVNKQGDEIVFAGEGSGTSAGWLAEGTSPTATQTAQFAKKTIDVHKVYAYWSATEEIVEDWLVNLTDFQQGFTMDDFADVMEQAFISGDGSGKPKGIIAATTQSSALGSGISATGFDTFYLKNGSALIAADPAAGSISDLLISVVGDLRTKYHPGSKWYMNRSTYAFLLKQRDHNNNYILQADFRSLSGNPAGGAGLGMSNIGGQLQGKPICIGEYFPDYNVNNNIGILFGNMRRAYRILDRGDYYYMNERITQPENHRHYIRKRMGGDSVDGRSMVFIQSTHI